MERTRLGTGKSPDIGANKKTGIHKRIMSRGQDRIRYKENSPVEIAPL